MLSSCYVYSRPRSSPPGFRAKLQGCNCYEEAAVLGKTCQAPQDPVGLLKAVDADLYGTYTEPVCNVFKLLILNNKAEELQKVGSFSEITQTSGFNVVQREPKKKR